MVRHSSARHTVALASVALAALVLVSLCGTGAAVAADRIVFAESFVNTG
jgi:hypothetical protein